MLVWGLRGAVLGAGAALDAGAVEVPAVSAGTWVAGDVPASVADVLVTALPHLLADGSASSWRRSGLGEIRSLLPRSSPSCGSSLVLPARLMPELTTRS